VESLKWTNIDRQRGTARACRTIQAIGSEWTFDDTRRKPSRRIVKLRKLLLEALQGLRLALVSRKGNSTSVYVELVFLSALGHLLKGRPGSKDQCGAGVGAALQADCAASFSQAAWDRSTLVSIRPVPGLWLAITVLV
jgi:integrase